MTKNSQDSESLCFHKTGDKHGVTQDSRRLSTQTHLPV